MESEHGSGSSKDSMTHPETAVGEGHLLLPSKNSGSSSSPSSGSSNQDFFQLDGSELCEPNAETTGPPKLDEGFLLALRDGEKDVSSNSLKSGASDLGSPEPTSLPDVSGFTPESSLHTGSMTQFPPIQVMGRSDDSNSYKIPSSVFARTKSTTPMEWSVASNESLFSIHVGNSSFSRDHVFLMGRSGELNKSGELISPNNKCEELTNFPNSPPPATAVADSDKNSSGLGEDLGVAEAAAETMREVFRAAADDHNKKKKPPAEGPRLSTSISHRSDGSGASISSFAFPILTGEGGRTGSLKVDHVQQSQPETPGATPNAGLAKWFPCFSCCSFCH